MKNYFANGWALRWIRLFSVFSASSLFGQVAGMLAGLIYVRYMPVEEYAIFAICLTLLTLLSLATDLGLTGSLTYFWRECGRRKKAFSSVLSEVRTLRLYLLVPCSFGVFVSLSWILSDTPYHGQQVLLLAALTIATGAAILSSAINLQALRLAGQLNSSYVAEVAGHGARLAVACLVLFGVTASVLIGLIGTFVGATMTMLVSHKFERRRMRHVEVEPHYPNVRQDLLAYALPVAAPVLVFALQNNLVLWSTAKNASHVLVAEVFALGRIGAMLAMFGAFINVVVIPKLASIAENRQFNRASLYVRLTVVAFSTVATLLAYLFPAPILLIIGHNYSHLEYELFVTVALAAVSLTTFTTVLINRARGWVKLDPIIAIVQAAVIFTLLSVWNYSSTENVLLLSLSLATSHLFLSTLINVIGVFSFRAVQLNSSKQK